MQKQHCTELKLTMKTTTLRNSFLWKLVYSLHSKPQWVTLLLKIKEMSILARQFCHPIRPVTANSLMFVWICWVWLSIFKGPFESWEDISWLIPHLVCGCIYKVDRCCLSNKSRLIHCHSGTVAVLTQKL